MCSLNAFSAPSFEIYPEPFVLEGFDHPCSVARCATQSSCITPVIIGATLVASLINLFVMARISNSVFMFLITQRLFHTLISTSAV